MTATRSDDPRTRRPQRQGGVTLELILALPLLLIALLAVVEIGVIVANVKHVAAASREGAKLAAQTPGLSQATTAATRDAVQLAINRRLESAGLGANAAQEVILRHTVADGDGEPPLDPPLPDEAVRVTVRVELTRLAPDLLGAFGFTLSGKTIDHSTTWAYEL